MLSNESAIQILWHGPMFRRGWKGDVIQECPCLGIGRWLMKMTLAETHTALMQFLRMQMCHQSIRPKDLPRSDHVARTNSRSGSPSWTLPLHNTPKKSGDTYSLCILNVWSSWQLAGTTNIAHAVSTTSFHSQYGVGHITNCPIRFALYLYRSWMEIECNNPSKGY